MELLKLNNKNYIQFEDKELKNLKILDSRDYKKYIHNKNHIINCKDKIFPAMSDEDFKLCFRNLLELDLCQKNIDMGTHMDREGDNLEFFNQKGLSTTIMLMIQRGTELVTMECLKDILSVNIMYNPEATHSSNGKFVTANPDFIDENGDYIEVQVYFKEEKLKPEDLYLFIKYSKYKKYDEILKSGKNILHIVKIINPKTYESTYLIFDIKKIFSEIKGDYVSEQTAFKVLDDDFYGRWMAFRKKKMMLYKSNCDYVTVYRDKRVA